MGKVVKGKWAENKSQASADTNKERIYQLKIALVASDPEIWRRVLVSGNATLAKLHKVIQTAMGWTDTHLHEFVMKGVIYAEPDPDMEGGRPRNERQARLYEVAPRARSSLLYIYDFGDGWEHKITVERIVDHDERFSGHPVCLDGRLSGPPEDCGGIFGYHDMLEIIKNPKHPEYEDTQEWLGDYFDPEEFDLEETNKVLRKLK